MYLADMELLKDNPISKTEREDERRKSVWKDYLVLTKVGIVNSNLMTVVAGFFLASYYNNLHLMDYLDKIIITLIGSYLVIAGSGSLNNYIDRDIDILMRRTKRRPSVSGRFSPRFILALGSSYVTIGNLLLFHVSITAGIAGFIGSFSYIVLYTLWTKRKYTLNTVVGSISGAMPPLIGWAAIDPALHPVAWVVFSIMFLWQIPHFLALAMKKTEDYRMANIPMLPVVEGFAMTKRQIMVWILCLLPLPFYMIDLSPYFVIFATLLNVGWLLIGLKGFKRDDDLKWANRIFVYSLNYLSMMFIAMIIFAIF